MKVGPIGVDKQLEKVLLSQYIYIEYLEDVLVYDEKYRAAEDSTTNADAGWQTNFPV